MWGDYGDMRTAHLAEGLEPYAVCAMEWTIEVRYSRRPTPSTARHGTIRTVHMTYAAALKATTHPKLGAENHMLQLNI